MVVIITCEVSLHIPFVFIFNSCRTITIHSACSGITIHPRNYYSRGDVISIKMSALPRGMNRRNHMDHR